MSTADDAKREKELGNECYKKRNFSDAIFHYEKAIALDPTQMTYLTNLAAVHFESKDYLKCIATCKQAVEVGRENRADYKLIAKALARSGNAHRKLNQLSEAKIAFEKALTEHRTPEYKTSLSEVESLIKREAELAYIDPEKAIAEKEKGNVLFKEGNFSAAVKCYSEAIRRNPEDYKVYSNRAACYTKLMSFDLALKDCDKALTLEPTFIKAVLRKAMVYRGMGQSEKAKEAYARALELDPNCSEAAEGYRMAMMSAYGGGANGGMTNGAAPSEEEARKRAMQDPEVQQILADPAMRLILEQMQSDPKAISEHLQNPEIAAKFMKLRQAGLIQVAYK